jgi:hypothetical protein
LIKARNLAVEHLGAQDRRSINVGRLLSEVLKKTGEVSRAHRLKRDVKLAAEAAKDQLSISAP